MINNLKKDFDQIQGLIGKKAVVDTLLINIISIIKQEIGVDLKKEDFFIKDCVFKIKINSNIRFLILLKLDKINQKIKTINKDIIVQL